MIFRSAWFVLAILLFTPVLRAQPRDRLCHLCDTTGKLPNEFHTTWQHLEKDVKFCSWCIDKDKVAHGLPWYPCSRCKNLNLKEKAEAEFEKKVALLMGWLDKRREIDKELNVKKPLLHLQTKHFVWAWNIPKFKGSDKKIYRMHNGLHLYAKRMEKFYDDFQKVHRITDKDNVENFHAIYCFERQLLAGKACVLYGEMATPNGRTTRQGNPSVFVNWWDKSLMPTDEYFFRSMIHNVNHLLTAVYKNHWWLHECGVAYEGSSHWWEIYRTGKASSRCFVEADSMSGWKNNKWQAIVKKAVLADRQPRIVDLLLIPGTSMKAADHVFAWSYIDFMIQGIKDEGSPQKIMKFYHVLKEKRPPRDAFREAFGMSVLAFEEAWKEYVLERYSVQDDEPAIPKRLRFR